MRAFLLSCRQLFVIERVASLINVVDMIIDLFGNRLAKKNPHLDFPEKQIQQEKKARSSFSSYPILEWCRWNGAYVYAYGCSIAGIICGLLSPILNMYVIGCSVI